MAKKIEVKQEENSEVVSVAPELTDSAFTMVKLGNRYSVLRVKLNPITNTVGEIELVQDDMNKQQAEEVFKINVARDVFMKGV